MDGKLWIGYLVRSRKGNTREGHIKIDWPDMEIRPCPICGDWKPSIKKALEDWNRRTLDENQPDLYKANNFEKIKKFTPEELARFIVWLHPNFCHNVFRPAHQQEKNHNGKEYTVCDGDCTACVLRFLDSKDGIYEDWFGQKKEFNPEEDLHI